MVRHEVDSLWGDQLCRHRQIAFVLAVLVIYHDDHASGLEFANGGFDVREIRGQSVRGQRSAVSGWLNFRLLTSDFRSLTSDFRPLTSDQAQGVPHLLLLGL